MSAASKFGEGAHLAELVTPATTALLTMEMQRGVVGSESQMKALAEEVARSGIIDVVAALCDAARRAGARVVHCLAENRPDGAGGAVNCRILRIADAARARGSRSAIESGSEGAQLVPELGPEPSDLVSSRIHGLTPFTSTSLDQVLRNLGVTTVVATGVSVNIGILGMCLSAVDLGYQVVVVRDAVAGLPAKYVDQAVEYTLSMVATIVTAQQLLDAWKLHSRQQGAH